jgi:hypothetical protein
MSPGYDDPEQVGFQRQIGEGCVICHVGRSETLDRSLHRMHITETAIGCERCHGPGELHVARHQGQQPAANRSREAIDYTIVTPSRLPRQLAEAICQQCHLRSTAVLSTRGRKKGDFRPGLPLEDFRQDYTLHNPEASMTVTGHVEQMHLSTCYKKSDTLTCLTCHNPHDMPRGDKRLGYYREVCLKCHQTDSCKVSESQRKKESPQNNCVHCHMPTAPTEIPHLAFTHHRIGIHRKQASDREPTQEGTELRPFLDLSRLNPIDQMRSLGLAYVEAANQEKDVQRRDHFREKALELMTRVPSARLRDPTLDATMARLRFDMRLLDDVLPFAQRAMEHPNCNGQDRCSALFLYADAHARQRRPAPAITALRELIKLRRHPIDYLLLADCERMAGNEAAVEEVLSAAVRIDPRLWKIHRYLADLYRQKGDAAKAAFHEKRAVP